MTLTLHQTGARIAASCLKRYQVERIDGLRPVFPWYAVGHAAHYVVEQLYRDSAIPGDRPRRDVAWQALNEWWDTVSDTQPLFVYREASSLVETIIRSPLSFRIPGGGTQMQVEWEWVLDAEVRAPRADEPFEPAYAGRFDAIVWGPWGVRVEDWKSSRSWPKASELYFDVQARVYCLAVLALFPGADEVTFRRVMLRHGYYQDVVFKRGEAWEEETKRWLAASRRRIALAHDEDRWPATPGEGCSLCPIAERCEEYAALRAQGAMAERLTDEQVARGHLALKRLAQQYENEARDRADTRPLPCGEGMTLQHVPGVKDALVYSAAEVFDELRALGATTEDLKLWFGRSVTPKKVREALEHLAAAGHLEHQLPSQEYASFVESVPTSTFTVRTFTQDGAGGAR